MTKMTKKIIVNLLTISRIVMAIFIPFIFSKLNFSEFIIILIIIFMTDFLDGKLSRFWHVQTIGGSLLDPIGDKLLAIACMYLLLRTDKTFLLLMIFEIIIGLINVYRLFSGIKTKSMLIGKIKTWLLSITIIFNLLYVFKLNVLTNFNLFFLSFDKFNFLLMFVTYIFESITILSYFITTLKEKTKIEKKWEFLDFEEIIKVLFDEKRFIKDKDRPFLEIIKR